MGSPAVICSIIVAILFLLLIVIGCAFGGMWLGAFIYHRGVAAGMGKQESFSGRVPEGDVFRITETIPEDPEGVFGGPIPDKKASGVEKELKARGARFLSSIGLT